MFSKWKLAPNTVSKRLAALRFLLHPGAEAELECSVRHRIRSATTTCLRCSARQRYQLIDAALTPLHRVMLMTLYATGGRRAELCRLKVSDIDSQRMVVHIRKGKGVATAMCP